MAILPEDLRTKETDPFIADQEVSTPVSNSGYYGTGKKMSSSMVLGRGLTNSADIQSTENEVMTDGCESEYEAVA